MEWVTPERTFVCLSGHSATQTEKLASIYDKGQSVSKEMAAVRDEHLRYRYEQGEKGIIWAGGALSGFGYALVIYDVNSLEEARKAQENDPYCLKGWSHPEKYFEWFIHMPLAKSAPSHQAKLESGLKEAGIVPRSSKSKPHWTTPAKLFVCLSKNTSAQTDRLTKAYGKGLTLSPEAEALRREHLCYVYDLGERGILWAGGPSGDASVNLSIYAVNSVEEAKKAKQNDPYYVKGMQCGDEYYEWSIHMPFDRASPGHRDKLKQDLARLGVIPA